MLTISISLRRLQGNKWKSIQANISLVNLSEPPRRNEGVPKGQWVSFSPYVGETNAGWLSVSDAGLVEVPRRTVIEGPQRIKRVIPSHQVGKGTAFFFNSNGGEAFMTLSGFALQSGLEGTGWLNFREGESGYAVEKLTWSLQGRP